MMKKTLSLMIMLSASLSTSLYARNAMKDITDYRKGLEQATVLNDQANVNIFAEALVGALTQAKVTRESKEKQAYKGVPLPDNRQVTKATYKWGKKATKEQADELRRALDVLAVVGYWEENDGRGEQRLAKLLSRVFDPSQANKKTHIGFASKRYQTTLAAIKEGKSSSVLHALVQAADSQLPYEQSTYVGQVHIKFVQPLVRFRYEDFYPASKPENGWIKSFHVNTAQDKHALGGTDVPTVVKEPSGEDQGAFDWDRPPPSSFGAHVPMEDFGASPMFGGGFGDGVLPYSMDGRYGHGHEPEPEELDRYMGGWGGPSLFSAAPGAFGGGMGDFGAPFAMRPGFDEGKQEQLDDAPPVYGAPHGGEIDLKAAEDELEPGAPPPSYKVSKRAEVAGQLEPLGNEKFAPIIANLKAKGNAKLGNAIQGLTGIARKPANRDEFYHAFRALEALAVVDKGLFKNAAENKTWAELSSTLIKGYVISLFKEKVPSATSSYSSSTYVNITYASTLEDLADGLLNFVDKWTNETDLQGVKAALKEINQTDIGKQALSKALRGSHFDEILARLKRRVQNVRLTKEFIRLFKEKVPNASGYSSSSYISITYATTLENLAEGVLDAVGRWTNETDLQGLITALTTTYKKGGIVKEDFDKVFDARTTSYAATVATISDKVIYAQAVNALRKALKTQSNQKDLEDTGSWTPLSTILQRLLAQSIYKDNEECLVNLKKFIKTGEGQKALATLQSQDKEGNLIPEAVKGGNAEETAANIQKYVIETE